MDRGHFLVQLLYQDGTIPFTGEVKQGRAGSLCCSWNAKEEFNLISVRGSFFLDHIRSFLHRCNLYLLFFQWDDRKLKQMLDRTSTTEIFLFHPTVPTTLLHSVSTVHIRIYTVSSSHKLKFQDMYYY